MRAMCSMRDLLDAAYAGLLAGVIVTGVQLFLWWAFWDVLPEIFYRDVRLTAAILLGSAILPPPVDFDGLALAAASVVHFSLSIVYGLLLAPIVTRRPLGSALLIGGAYGALIYVVNLYGLVYLFPWFEMVRDWITFVTHVAFGVAAAGVYMFLSRRRAPARAGRGTGRNA